jgi:hypothetical protein
MNNNNKKVSKWGWKGRLERVIEWVNIMKIFYMNV